MVPNNTQMKANNWSLLDLSDEILLQIFCYIDSTDLYQLSCTCERLRNIVEDDYLWKWCDGRASPNNGEKHDFCKRNYCQRTTAILLAGATKGQLVVDTKFITELKRFENLTILALENQFIDGNVPLALYPEKLVELSLKNSYVSQYKTFFKNCASNLNKLRVFVLDRCNWFDCHSILALSKLPKLVILSMYMCKRLSDKDICYLSIAGRFGFKTLQVLDIRFTMYGEELLKSFYRRKNLSEIYFQNYVRTYPSENLARKMELLCGEDAEEIGAYAGIEVDDTDSAELFKTFGQNYDLEKVGTPNITDNSTVLFRDLAKSATGEYEPAESVLYRRPYAPCTCNKLQTEPKPIRDLDQYNQLGRMLHSVRVRRRAKYLYLLTPDVAMEEERIRELLNKQDRTELETLEIDHIDPNVWDQLETVRLQRENQSQPVNLIEVHVGTNQIRRITMPNMPEYQQMFRDRNRIQRQNANPDYGRIIVIDRLVEQDVELLDEQRREVIPRPQSPPQPIVAVGAEPAAPQGANAQPEPNRGGLLNQRDAEAACPFRMRSMNRAAIAQSMWARGIAGTAGPIRFWDFDNRPGQIRNASNSPSSIPNRNVEIGGINNPIAAVPNSNDNAVAKISDNTQIGGGNNNPTTNCNKENKCRDNCGVDNCDNKHNDGVSNDDEALTNDNEGVTMHNEGVTMHNEGVTDNTTNSSDHADDSRKRTDDATSTKPNDTDSDDDDDKDDDKKGNACKISVASTSAHKSNQIIDNSDNKGVFDNIPMKVSNDIEAMIINKQTVTNDNEGVTKNNENVKNDNKVVTNDIKGVNKNNEAVINDNEGVTKGDEGVSKDNEGVTNDNKDATNDIKYVTKDNEGVTNNDEGVTKYNEGVTNVNEGVTNDNRNVSNDNTDVTNDIKDVTGVAKDNEVHNEDVSKDNEAVINDIGVVANEGVANNNEGVVIENVGVANEVVGGPTNAKRVLVTQSMKSGAINWASLADTFGKYDNIEIEFNVQENNAEEGERECVNRNANEDEDVTITVSTAPSQRERAIAEEDNQSLNPQLIDEELVRIACEIAQLVQNPAQAATKKDNKRRGSSEERDEDKKRSKIEDEALKSQRLRSSSKMLPTPPRLRGNRRSSESSAHKRRSCMKHKKSSKPEHSDDCPHAIWKLERKVTIYTKRMQRLVRAMRQSLNIRFNPRPIAPPPLPEVAPADESEDAGFVSEDDKDDELTSALMDIADLESEQINVSLDEAVAAQNQQEELTSFMNQMRAIKLNVQELQQQMQHIRTQNNPAPIIRFHDLRRATQRLKPRHHECDEDADSTNSGLKRTSEATADDDENPAGKRIKKVEVAFTPRHHEEDEDVDSISSGLKRTSEASADDEKSAGKRIKKVEVVSMPSSTLASTPSSMVASTLASIPSSMVASTVASTPSSMVASMSTSTSTSTPSSTSTSTPSSMVASTLASTPSSMVASTAASTSTSTSSSTRVSMVASMPSSTPSSTVASMPQSVNEAIVREARASTSNENPRPGPSNPGTNRFESFTTHTSLSSSDDDATDDSDEEKYAEEKRKIIKSNKHRRCEITDEDIRRQYEILEERGRTNVALMNQAFQHSVVMLQQEYRRKSEALRRTAELLNVHPFGRDWMNNPSRNPILANPNPVNPTPINANTINPTSTNANTINANTTNENTTNLTLTNANTTNPIPTNANTTNLIPINANTTNPTPTNANTNPIPKNTNTTNANTINPTPTNANTTNPTPINANTTNLIPINANTTNPIPINANTTNANIINPTPINANTTNLIPINANTANPIPINANTTNANTINPTPTNANTTNPTPINANTTNTIPIYANTTNANIINPTPINANTTNLIPINANTANPIPINANTTNANTINPTPTNANTTNPTPINANTTNTIPINANTTNPSGENANTSNPSETNANTTNPSEANANTTKANTTNPSETNANTTNANTTNPSETNAITSNPSETNAITTNANTTNPSETNAITSNPSETNANTTNPIATNSNTTNPPAIHPPPQYADITPPNWSQSIRFPIVPTTAHHPSHVSDNGSFGFMYPNQNAHLDGIYAPPNTPTTPNPIPNQAITNRPPTNQQAPQQASNINASASNTDGNEINIGHVFARADAAIAGRSNQASDEDSDEDNIPMQADVKRVKMTTFTRRVDSHLARFEHPPMNRLLLRSSQHLAQPQQREHQRHQLERLHQLQERARNMNMPNVRQYFVDRNLMGNVPTSLTYLSFRGFRGVSDRTLDFVAHLHLELLDVTSTEVTVEGVRRFLKTNPKCRVIHEAACRCAPRLHF